MEVTKAHETIETESDFQEALEKLLRRARENDVDVRGGWECQTDDRDLDWEITVMELAKKRE